MEATSFDLISLFAQASIVVKIVMLILGVILGGNHST